MTTASKRKKYIRPMEADWWKHHPFYRFYMMREATAIFSLWFSFVLFYGVICLSKSAWGIFGAYKFIEFLSNPIVVFLNLIALGAAILNTVTYFRMTPKVMNLIIKGEKLDPKLVTQALWGITAIVSIIVILWLVI